MCAFTVTFIAKGGDRKNIKKSVSKQLQKNGQWLFSLVGMFETPQFWAILSFFLKWFEFLDANIGQMSMKTIQVLSGHVASSTQTLHLRHHEVSLISMSTLSGFYVPGSVGQQHIRETKNNNGDGKEDAGKLEKKKVLDYTLEKSNTERWEDWKKRYGNRYVFFQLDYFH